MNGTSENHYTAVMGMVISVSPVGEYNRRVVLLTRELGKISCFARGARKPGSPLMASTDLFCFGTYRLFAGKDSYTIAEADISNYFTYFRSHIYEACVASYFLEIMDYCTRENNDEAQLLLLLYCALSALENGRLPASLVRSIFEIKTVMLEGEYPGLPENTVYTEAAMYALKVLNDSAPSGIFCFTLSPEAEAQLQETARQCMWSAFHHHFASLEVLETLAP